ncbi:PRD domain-containing protein [Arthrobacter sp. MA-N2]|uniref:PRD domain-containing protein n=1 Tax=Arthrobacter sp. MA-N2 TaxID=1101188 RepID=UPI0009DE0C2D|nr:PRD domain-containing protein [Arthrobacter sp. MA-N2]
MTGTTQPHDTAPADVRESFRERLDLLEDSGMASPVARKLAESALLEITRQFSLELTEENAAPFVTHLVIALTRLQRGEAEAAPSEAVESEITGRDREKTVIGGIMHSFEDELGRPVPESEISYITVHLCALLEED